MAGSSKETEILQTEPFIVYRKDLEKVLKLIREEEKKKDSRPNFCISDGNLSESTILGRMTRKQQLLYHLNKFALSHDWSSVAACVKYLIELNEEELTPIILKSTSMVLYYHPDSSPEELDNFLQTCVGLQTKEEKLKYLNQILGTLPVNPGVFCNYVNKGGQLE